MARLSPLATPSATREVLERHGLFTKYSLGQNFLINDDIVRKILEVAQVNTADVVLEVGPGIGTLTAALLQKVHAVISIEKDPDLPAVLDQTLAPWSAAFTLVQKDALDVHAADVQRDDAVPNKLVANLPYAVAATVTLDYLQRFTWLQSATVMVQKEVADRMMAQPGTKAYGAYTVKLSLYAHPAARFSVAPGNFFPPPHVESAVIRLDRVDAPRCAAHVQPEELRRATCIMADAAFANRRKTLANSCKTFFSTCQDFGVKNSAALSEVLQSMFAYADIDSARRGETLTQEEFIRLGCAFALLRDTY